MYNTHLRNGSLIPTPWRQCTYIKLFEIVLYKRFFSHHLFNHLFIWVWTHEYYIFIKLMNHSLQHVKISPLLTEAELGMCAVSEKVMECLGSLTHLNGIAPLTCWQNPCIFKSSTHSAKCGDYLSWEICCQKEKGGWEWDEKRVTSYRCSSLPSPDSRVNWGEGLEENKVIFVFLGLRCGF